MAGQPDINWDLLDYEAAEIVRAARGAPSDATVESEDLLCVLMARRNRATWLAWWLRGPGRLALGGRTPRRRPPPVSKDLDLVMEAVNEARCLGATQASPEHLLIAALLNPAGERAERLTGTGVTPERLRAAMRRQQRGRDPSDPRVPLEVGLCVFWLIVLVFVSLFLLVMSLQAARDINGAICLVQASWSVVLPAVCVVSLLGQKRWAWSVTGSFIFAHEVVALGTVAAGLISLLTRRQENLIWLGLLIVPLLASLSAPFVMLFFGSRGWFGVPEREKWRTLWREGWWALLITGLLDLATVAVLVFQPSP